MTRRFRGAIYRITVENPQHVSKGVVRCEVNGQPLSGEIVPLAEAGQTVDVRIVMGAL